MQAFIYVPVYEHTQWGGGICGCVYMKSNTANSTLMETPFFCVVAPESLWTDSFSIFVESRG